jgi:hypothetical protein
MILNTPSRVHSARQVESKLQRLFGSREELTSAAETVKFAAIRIHPEYARAVSSHNGTGKRYELSCSRFKQVEERWTESGQVHHRLLLVLAYGGICVSRWCENRIRKTEHVRWLDRPIHRTTSCPKPPKKILRGVIVNHLILSLQGRWVNHPIKIRRTWKVKEYTDLLGSYNLEYESPGSSSVSRWHERHLD